MSGGLFGVGSGEIILILLIILLVMGPDRLPQIVRLWGQAMRFVGKFSNTWNQMNAELMRKIEEESKPIEGALRLEDEASPGPTTPPAAPEPSAPDDDPDPLLNTIAPPELTGPPVTTSEPPILEAAPAATSDAAETPDG